jgi:hypothetical protein
MEIKNLPAKYIKLWNKCLPVLRQGRPGDDSHAKEVAEFILNYSETKFNKDVLIPVAILHDIGHSAILPQHFKYITGTERVRNAKLVHMLVGAKIANDILCSINYNPINIDEIVDIVSMHDADQLEDVDIGNIYNTENKKLFHDIDSMDRYNAERLKLFLASGNNKDKVIKMLNDGIEKFFYPELKAIATERLKSLGTI